jgi:hypothetical protein
VDVGSLYFPRAGTLRTTNGYVLVIQSAQTAGRNLPQAGRAVSKLSGLGRLVVKEKRSRMTRYGSLRFQISLLAVEGEQCHAD